LDTKQLEFRVQIGNAVRHLDVNAYLLRLVLDNLVDNAIKFTDAGGRISVNCQPVEAKGTERQCGAAISVEDTGCGIAEEEQTRVFERFYQIGKARSGRDRGTGLGLSIVRHASAAMGGTVDLASEPGRGTCVTLTVKQIV
jgi:signal transduction histidine kinase